MAADERFMRLLIDRWLDDPKIIGSGDDGQRIGGLTLEQEAVYFRLCLTQFRQTDGYLPNRRAFLCDASACAVASYETLVSPVLNRFFRKTKDGLRYFNLRTRDEWERAHSKSSQASAAAEERWRKRRDELASTGADAHADAYADASCERERESKRESKRDNNGTAACAAGEVRPAEPTVKAPAKTTAFAERLVSVWNAATKQSRTPLPKTAKRVAEALRAGYSEQHQLAAMLVAIASWRARDGIPPKVHPQDVILVNGRSTSGQPLDWLDWHIRSAHGLTVSPGLCRLAREYGVAELLDSWGAHQEHQGQRIAVADDPAANATTIAFDPLAAADEALRRH